MFHGFKVGEKVQIANKGHYKEPFRNSVGLVEDIDSSSDVGVILANGKYDLIYCNDLKRTTLDLSSHYPMTEHERKNFEVSNGYAAYKANTNRSETIRLFITPKLSAATEVKP